MENKKILNIIAVVFVVWLVILTIVYFFLSQSVSSMSEKINLLSSVVSVASEENNSGSKLSAFAVEEGGKIFGKYNAEDFGSFGGWFVSKITAGNNTVLVVPGYLNLKPETLAKETQSGKLPSPNFQMETKYIAIGKDTKIVDDQGNVVKIDDMAPEDSLTVIPYEAAEYPATYMLAAKITVSKKVWPEGENPFK